MKILKALLSNLNTEAVVRDVRQGPFQTAVLTRNCGLASTPHYWEHNSTPVAEPGLLLGKNPKALTHLANSSSLHEATIGIATINSLIAIDEKYCIKVNAGDLIAEKGFGKRIAIVGHFPFVKTLRGIAMDLWVIEKNPRENAFKEDQANDFVPRAHVVCITGTVFTNHTIEHLLELCDPKAFVVIIGDSSPLSPILFDFGIDAISGTKVTNPDLALLCVSQGATFRQIKGIELLTIMKNRY